MGLAITKLFRSSTVEAASSNDALVSDVCPVPCFLTWASYKDKLRVMLGHRGGEKPGEVIDCRGSSRWS